MLTEEFTERLYKKAIDKYGALMQTVVAIEEMAELQKELSKALRSKENYCNLVEEIADVEIMLAQIKIIYDISDGDVIAQKDFKLRRLEHSLKEG